MSETDRVLVVGDVLTYVIVRPDGRWCAARFARRRPREAWYGRKLHGSLSAAAVAFG